MWHTCTHSEVKQAINPYTNNMHVCTCMYMSLSQIAAMRRDHQSALDQLQRNHAAKVLFFLFFCCIQYVHTYIHVHVCGVHTYMLCMYMYVQCMATASQWKLILHQHWIQPRTHTCVAAGWLVYNNCDVVLA